MHEMSIASALVDQVCDQAASLGAARVAEINLKMGVLNGISRALHFCWPSASRDTLCEGARLNIDEVPLTVLCTHCDAVKTPAALYNFRCPDCGRPTPKVLATRVRLDSTLIGSSPTCPPRLRLAKSPTLDPPRVEVKPQSTPRPPSAGICSRQWNMQLTLAEPVTGAVQSRHGRPKRGRPARRPTVPYDVVRAGRRLPGRARCYFRKSGTSSSSLSSKVTVRGGRAAGSCHCGGTAGDWPLPAGTCAAGG